MKSQRKIPAPGRKPDPETPIDSSSEETLVEMGRLNALNDGVFAIALTILVLDIRLPDVTQPADLGTILIELGPRFMVYLISFIIIGGAWGSHQRMLTQIKRGDGPLVWLSLFSLLFVTLLPAAAGVLGRFPGTLLAILIFSADVILIQVGSLVVWRHARNYQLINPALDPRVADGIGRRLGIIAIAFVLTLPLALVNTALVYAVWIVLFLFIFTTDWISWQQGLKTSQESIPRGTASRAHIKLYHTMGTFLLKSGTSQDVLLEGTFGGGAKCETQIDGDLLDINLVAMGKGGFLSFRYPWAWSKSNELDWDVRLSPKIPLQLEVMSYLGEADLDFSDLLITDLLYTSSSSTAKLSLPAHAGHMAVAIRASKSSIDICLPAGVEAAIHSPKKSSGIEVDPTRFEEIEQGQEYKTTGYDSAANRVEILLEFALGSVAIK